MSATKTKSVKKTKTVAKVKTAAKPKTVSKPKTVRATEPYHPGFGIILLIICVLLLAVLVPFVIARIVKPAQTDAARFAEEYSLVETDNLFVYKTPTEITNILEHGTGIVFLGFPECPWCKAYAPMLNSLANAHGIKEIAYYNIFNDRKNNTEFYQKLVALLGDHLQYDDAGEKRIYVPEAVFVIDGEIIGNDHETSKDTLGLQTPEAYWTEERTAAWREKVEALIVKITDHQGCATTCNE